MADRLDEIRARRDAAKGPWHFEERDDDIVVHVPLPDAEFIAKAPADVGWLLEHIEQLQQEIQRVTRANAEQQLRLSRERDRLRVQRQAVLDLCDQADRNALPLSDETPAITTDGLRRALGAANER